VEGYLSCPLIFHFLFVIFVLGFVRDFDGNGDSNLLVSSERQDLSESRVHLFFVLHVFLFLQFLGVFSCDFLFTSFTSSFHEIFHGSVNPRCCDSMAQILFRFMMI